MHRYKRYIPIAALILVALGFNLDRFGIDLERLAGTGSQGSSQSTARRDEQGTRDSKAISAQGRSNAPQHPDYAQWSKTEPNINLWHVFEGEINRSGKPVGFHSRPDGEDPANARVVSVRDRPNRLGVYTARIAIRDGNEWKEKFSSFFPDALSRDEVMEAVLNAYRNSSNPRAQPFEGPSGLGFTIQGYTSGRGGINTAFPIFVKNP